MNMIDAIHIGDYKTGTTWLQQKVFQQHPELIYIDWPADYPEIAKLFYELVDARDLDFDAESLRHRFNVEIAKINHAGKKLIVSREALSGEFTSGEHAKRIAVRLYQVFGPTKILLVIREQFSMLASIYSQYVKIGGTLSLPEFVWDPLAASNLISRLQYEKQIDAYMETFGLSNVSVKVFEELKFDKVKYLQEILAFIGCQDIHFFPKEPDVSNPSLTTVGAYVQRLLNRFVRTKTNPSASIIPLDKIVRLFLSGSQKESLLKSAAVQLPWAPIESNPAPYLLYAINMGLNLKLSEWCEGIRQGGKIQVSPQLRERLAPSFISSNRILAERYGLSLEKYGWVL
jgi:hypothetical protein